MKERKKTNYIFIYTIILLFFMVLLSMKYSTKLKQSYLSLMERKYFSEEEIININLNKNPGLEIIRNKKSVWDNQRSREIKIVKEMTIYDLSDTNYIFHKTINVISDKKGNIYEKQLVKKNEYPCMFEFVYFAKPDSRINGRSVHNVRVELGRLLAKKHPVEADIVVPIPESGRRFATGFSRESGIPLDEGLMKDKYERSFIQQTQKSREETVEEGLAFIRSVLGGKRVVLIDDSIVRGTTMRKIVEGVRKAGAKEVHIRIGCPPLIAPCYLGIDMRSKKEFIARKKNGEKKSWDEIRKEIGADSLAYTDLQDLKEAIGFNFCAGCIDFPDGYPQEMQRDAVKFFEQDQEGKRAYHEIRYTLI